MSSDTRSPASVFVAATSLLLAASPLPAIAQEQGGWKEWTTDQALDAESVLDADSRTLMNQAQQEEICVPIGEGENCW